MQIPVQLDLLSAFVDDAREDVDPGSFRQPGICLSQVYPWNLRGGDGGNHQAFPEEVLVFRPVGLPLFRILIVQGLYEGFVLLKGPVVHGVQIGDHPVAETEKLPHHLMNLHGETPGLFPSEVPFGAVETVDGREHPELYPAQNQHIVPGSAHVSADVMAPPAVADVGGGAGKVRLKVQGRPGSHRISGKTDGIAVRAVAGIPGKGHGTLSVPAAVQEVDVIEHPQRIQSGDLGSLSLLPVDPPEVHSLFLHGVKDAGEVGFYKLRIRHVKFDGFLCFLVHPHHLGDLGIDLLIGSDSQGRVKIQGGVHSLLFKPGKKTGRIREEIPVPGKSGPAASVLWIHRIHQMPVHVDDSHGKRNTLLLELPYQFFVTLFRVLVIPAPPVSQSKPGKKRSLAGQLVVIPKGSPIVCSIHEEIEITLFGNSRGDPSIPVKSHGSGIIQNRPALQGEDAVIQGTFPFYQIQSADRSLQVAAFSGFSVSPLGNRGEHSSGSLSQETVSVPGDPYVLCCQLPAILLLFHCPGDRGKLPVHHHLGGPVLKNSLLTVLQPYQAGGEKGKTELFTLKDVFLSSYRFHFQQVIHMHYPPSSFFAGCIHYQRGRPSCQAPGTSSC